MSNIHTLGGDDDNKSRRRSNSSDDENSDEGRQGFFVGGSERSGQEVLGPNRNENVSADHFFEAIRRAGAERITQEQNEALNTPRQTGGGDGQSQVAFRLGGHGMESERIGETSATAGGTSRQQAPVVVRLVFWNNGFTVDDGPLRQFQDPQNREFLQAVMTKRIPAELTMAAPGREIDLRIEKKGTDYEQPKTKAFSGQGNQLGTITPNVGGAADVVFVDAPPKLTEEETAKLVEQAQAELKVDDNLPTTRIQIRIPDAARPIVARLNQTHTVNQLRIFIVTADPSLAYRPFRLMTSYPTQPIDDEGLSVKDAGLLNATFCRRMDIGNCCICLGGFGVAQMGVLPCLHTFHHSCIERALVQSAQCPLCRRRATVAQIVRPKSEGSGREAGDLAKKIFVG
ncbi:hypothetical protein niasHT_019476 [Heterodera trifolii]|uniref:RING-type domain-containing protein n=1 Tax=Heterodera trifolii TaxID=157864 RepID=A0ABD2KWU2_9BILA